MGLGLVDKTCALADARGLNLPTMTKIYVTGNTVRSKFFEITVIKYAS